jgi:hypothetical protein
MWWEHEQAAYPVLTRVNSNLSRVKAIDFIGAPFRIKLRTHTQLKLLVIFPAPENTTAFDADFGLTRCGREFQRASRQRAPFALGS